MFPYEITSLTFPNLQSHPHCWVCGQSTKWDDIYSTASFSNPQHETHICHRVPIRLNLIQSNFQSWVILWCGFVCSRLVHPDGSYKRCTMRYILFPQSYFHRLWPHSYEGCQRGQNANRRCIGFPQEPLMVSRFYSWEISPILLDIFVSSQLQLVVSKTLSLHLILSCLCWCSYRSSSILDA